MARKTDRSEETPRDETPAENATPEVVTTNDPQAIVNPVPSKVQERGAVDPYEASVEAGRDPQTNPLTNEELNDFTSEDTPHAVDGGEPPLVGNGESAEDADGLLKAWRSKEQGGKSF